MWDDVLLPFSRYLPRDVEHRLRRRIHDRAPTQHIADLSRMRREVFPPGHTLSTSEQLGCLFIHVPKCAGMSVAKSLFGNMGPGHISADEYQLIYTPDELDRLFKFTFVRNPWDRLASAFFFLKSGGMNEFDAAFAEEHLAPYDDFEQFVCEWVDENSIQLFFHFRPQMHYLAVNQRLMKLDFIGRFERLADDFRTVCHRLGIAPNLAWTNRTPDRVNSYSSLYTRAMVKKVGQLYARDVKALGYSFADTTTVSRRRAA
jgi:hypothetical protein